MKTWGEMKKSYLIILIAIIVFGGAVAFFGVNNLIPPSPIGYSTLSSAEETTDAATEQKSDFEKLEEAVSREKMFEEKRRPNRDTYGIPMEVFEEMPLVPDDFGTMAYMFEIGKWKDLKYFTEGYYKQPEFYPGFEKTGLRWWLEPDPSSWGVIGWGAYPADIWANTFAGTEFEARTFWHVGWGVQTHQGFQLMPVFPQSSKDQNGLVFNTQDPAIVSKYFDVSFDKKVFLLGPAYPKFDSNWARVVKINVKVHEGTPKGQYVLGLDVGVPPEDIRTEWLKEYKMMYFDASSGGLTLGRPHFRLIINVN